MPKTPRVAYEPGDVRDWTGRGIVVDLFRFSNTVCALLQSGRQSVRVYSGAAHAASVRDREKLPDFFSEIDFNPPIEKYDNSPYIALKGSDTSRPALIATNSGSPAVVALQQATEILIGCFANLPALTVYCASHPLPTLIVPACLFYNREHVEDFICARSIADALEGKDSYEAALLEIHQSGRVLDFLTLGRSTGRQDMELILQKGNMPVVPRVKLHGVYGTVEKI